VLSDTSFFLLAVSYSSEGYSSQVGVKDISPVMISLPSFHMVDVLPYNIIYLVCLLHCIAISPVTHHSVYSKKMHFVVACGWILSCSCRATRLFLYC